MNNVQPIRDATPFLLRKDLLELARGHLSDTYHSRYGVVSKKIDLAMVTNQNAKTLMGLMKELDSLTFPKETEILEMAKKLNDFVTQKTS